MLTLVRNARLFTPADAGVTDLLIAGRRIAHVGAGIDDLPSWAVSETVDLQGRTVVPALVDGHVHVTGGGGEAGFGSRIAPLPAARYRAAGIGTAVGVLGTDDTTRTTGSLVAWTRELAAQGLGAYCMTGGYHVPPTTLTGSVRGDIAFVDVIVGVGEIAISDHRSSHPDTAELVRLASDAHVGGLMTGKAGILHLHVGDGPGGLEPVRKALEASDLPARTFQPTHVNRNRSLFDEALELAESGVPIDLTAFPVEEDEDAWPAEVALVRYLESPAPGGAVTVSSDGGGCLPVFGPTGAVESFATATPGSLLETLRAAVLRGLPLEAALPAFCSNPARVLRLADRGGLHPGAIADLLILDDDLHLVGAAFSGSWHDHRGEAIAVETLQELLK